MTSHSRTVLRFSCGVDVGMGIFDVSGPTAYTTVHIFPVGLSRGLRKISVRTRRLYAACQTSEGSSIAQTT